LSIVNGWVDDKHRSKTFELKQTADVKLLILPFLEVRAASEAANNQMMGSTTSIKTKLFLENSVNWHPVIKKYRLLKASYNIDD
jgi:hypothetical protein